MSAASSMNPNAIQTEKFSVSPSPRIRRDATVKSIPSVVGDKGNAIATRQQNMNRQAAERAANVVAAGWAELGDFDKQHAVLHEKAADVIKKMNTEIATVLKWFAHKKVHEKLFGKYSTQDEWTQAALNMTVRGVKYHMATAKPHPLLPPAPKILSPDELAEKEERKRLERDTPVKVFDNISDAAPEIKAGYTALEAFQAASRTSSITC